VVDLRGQAAAVMGHDRRVVGRWAVRGEDHPCLRGGTYLLPGTGWPAKSMPITRAASPALTAAMYLSG